ncbi:hypothetical protein GCM10023184_30290 [Flaviaesturariibacter amylovorans]|uniref:Response regulatory domain-containing protein n=2 Tax=Flaviaesturariibacter amylovorans TaxID=1084520 RepID=A0ABP8H873_9BACT
MVDDDEDDLLVFESVLNSLSPSTRFRAFTTGIDLLAQLSAETPDLIFLDLNMPGMNGHECLRRIRGRGMHALPVIAFSGSDFGRVIDDSFSSGATMFLTKPMSMQQLSAQLTALFVLDWTDPGTIRRAQRQGERFVPFSAI